MGTPVGNLKSPGPGASQVALVVKNLPASAGDLRDMCSIPGSRRCPGGGHDNPLQCSCLGNPMDRAAWRAAVHGVTESQTRLKWLRTHTFMCVYVYTHTYIIYQFSSLTQSCKTLWYPMDCSTPGLPVHHQFLDLAQTHVHWDDDTIQPFHPLSFPSPPAFNLSPHQSLFKWVNSLHQVAKVLTFQL